MGHLLAVSPERHVNVDAVAYSTWIEKRGEARSQAFLSGGLTHDLASEHCDVGSAQGIRGLDGYLELPGTEFGQPILPIDATSREVASRACPKGLACCESGDGEGARARCRSVGIEQCELVLEGDHEGESVAALESLEGALEVGARATLPGRSIRQGLISQVKVHIATRDGMARSALRIRDESEISQCAEGIRFDEMAEGVDRKVGWHPAHS
jgi:hypothetical protein